MPDFQLNNFLAPLQLYLQIVVAKEATKNHPNTLFIFF